LTISGIWQGTFFPKQAEIFRGSGGEARHQERGGEKPEDGGYDKYEEEKVCVFLQLQPVADLI
jgi:hypothetical protein